MLGRFTIPCVAALCLTADYLSKSWARSHLEVGGSVPFIPGILRFTLTTNTGAAFSLGAGNAEFMTLLALTMTIAISVWIAKREFGSDPPTKLERIGMGCILGGAIGNLVDRFVLGRVTDFLEFAFISFPVFNVADSLIDVGIGLVIISAIAQAKKASAQAATEQRSPDAAVFENDSNVETGPQCK